MKLLAYLQFFANLLQLTNNQLIKSNVVYENIAKGVCDYYHCNAIIFFVEYSNTSADTEELWTESQKIFKFFSKNYIQITVTNIENFIVQGNNALQRINNNLIVFLNDSNRLKIQFQTKLAPLLLMDMSAPIFLIFVQDKTKIDDFFANFHVPFNCRFMVSKRNTRNDKSEIITEIYRIDAYKELRHDIFGYWNSDTGMQVPILSLYKRRNNLHGHTLRVTAINSLPGSVTVTDKNNKMKLWGMFGAIMEILQERMNFTSTYHTVTDYGSRLADGTWTGGIGSLVYNDADIFSSDLRMIAARFEAIQFTAPLFMSKECFYFKKPLSTLSWKIFLKPFSVPIWMSIIWVMLLTNIVVRLISLIDMKYNRQKMYKKSPNYVMNILDIFGAFCSQAMPKSVINSIAIIQFTVHLTGVVILAAYSGVLISTLAVNTFVPPFKTLEGFINDGSYRMGVLGYSADYNFFQNATDNITKQIFENILIKEEGFLPSTTAKGLERVCNEDKYAFLSSDLPVSQFEKPNCILIASGAVSLSSLAIGLHPNSSFRELINSHIYSLRDRGILKKIEYQWTKSAPINVDENWQSVHFTEVIPIIAFLIFTGILSITILLCEQIVYKKSKKVREIPITIFKKSNTITYL